MKRRELERLLDLLGDLSEEDFIDGQHRDYIARLRDRIYEELDQQMIRAPNP